MPDSGAAPDPAPIVLAFSGGLDTSFCVPYLKETYGAPVVTVTVNTGGFNAEQLAEVEARALELGAAAHRTVDARQDLWDETLRYLVMGNVLRGQVYPLCVGPERVTQARKALEVARELGAQALAHGSTGAGNDQVRFDVAVRILGEGMKVITPIRELALSRDATADYLDARGFAVNREKAAYSINRGLWGTTIGGKETHRTDGVLPNDAYPDTTAPEDAPDVPRDLLLHFDEGVPTKLDGESLSPVAIVERLAELGGQHGVGRGMHVGDTILGIKGRVGFEAAAAAILIPAHRELEKLVLTRWQRYQKDHAGDFYGMLLHEGQYFDPVMRDLEALFESSQQAVTGDVTVRLFKGSATVLGATAPASMFNTGVATYGEENTLWDGRDAEGFTTIYGVHALLAHRARAAR